MVSGDTKARFLAELAYKNFDIDDKFMKEQFYSPDKAKPLSELISKTEADNWGLTSNDVSQWKVVDVYNNPQTGFSAYVIETAPGQISVTFRGTDMGGSLDESIPDLVDGDLTLLNSTMTAQQKDVENFLKAKEKLWAKYDSVEMVGHSLGGNLAEYATVISASDKYRYLGLDRKITKCTSLDGPGFSQEFIDKYQNEIRKMAGRMYHPRWSFVGTLLCDLSEDVDYRFVKANNDNLITKHSLKYLAIEDGNFVPGKQDFLSVALSLISRGIDHLPDEIGNLLLEFTCSLLLTIEWLDGILYDENGLTPLGYMVLSEILAVIIAVGPLKVIGVTLGAIVTMILALAVVGIYEIVYETVVKVVDWICETAEKVYHWAKDVVQNFKEAVINTINNVKSWWDSLFDKDKKSNVSPIVRLNTGSMKTYASRLDKVNGRMSNLDDRLDSLYWKVGLRDLLDLLSADFRVGYSSKLKKCADYLRATASEYETLEQNLQGKLGS